MKATKIKMKASSQNSNQLTEIDSIYIEGCKEPRFYKKEGLHDYVKENPGSIKVNINPYPSLIPATSVNNEKYVKSEANSIVEDNLLKLPRE